MSERKYWKCEECNEDGCTKVTDDLEFKDIEYCFYNNSHDANWKEITKEEFMQEVGE